MYIICSIDEVERKERNEGTGSNVGQCGCVVYVDPSQYPGTQTVERSSGGGDALSHTLLRTNTG